MPPQKMPLWHKYVFELKAIENQQMQEEIFPPLFSLKAGHEFSLRPWPPIPNQEEENDSCHQRWRMGTEMSLHKQTL